MSTSPNRTSSRPTRAARSPPHGRAAHAPDARVRERGARRLVDGHLRRYARLEPGAGAGRRRAGAPPRLRLLGPRLQALADRRPAGRPGRARPRPGPAARPLRAGPLRRAPAADRAVRGGRGRPARIRGGREVYFAGFRRPARAFGTGDLPGGSMRHHRLLGATAIAAALVFAGSAAAQERVFFGIATGGTGGTYYPLGGMLAQLISNKVTIGGKKLAATAETAGASVANAQLLARKDIESAFVAADILDAAYNGKGQFDGKAVKNLRALGALYPEQVQLVTLASANVQLVQGPQGQVGVVGLAGIRPVAAAGRPPRGPRHDAQGHRRGPVVVHAVGRQDQGRQSRRVADHRRRADILDQRSRQCARRPHRAARRARDRGAAQEAAVLRDGAAAGQHVQGPDRAGRTRWP